ncbi:LINES protein, partial [Polyodon spathula]|nr:LINES protein [Polyodon spathula]
MQLAFHLAENVPRSELPKSQTKCNVKYSDDPLVDYGSSDESGSDLVEPVCLATGKQCSEGLQDDSFKIGNSVCQSGDKDQTLSKHCQVTGDQGMLMHSSLRDNMLYDSLTSAGMFTKSIMCLMGLRKAVTRLQRRNLFPYNPTALLKLLIQIETKSGLTDDQL